MMIIFFIINIIPDFKIIINFFKKAVGEDLFTERSSPMNTYKCVPYLAVFPRSDDTFTFLSRTKLFRR